MNKSLRNMMEDKNKKLSTNDKNKINNIKNKTQKYNDMSKDQILNELLNMKKNSKSSVDNKSIEEFKSFIAPMLDDNHKSQLDSILNQIKKQK